MTTCAEVLNCAVESGVTLSVKEGRLSIRGSADAVEFVKRLAVEVRDELIARLAPPQIELTHRTTTPLIFHDPETGKEKTIATGTPCRQFFNPQSAQIAGVRFSYDQSWAATRNLQNGYALVWLDGMLRGVSFDDVELIDGDINSTDLLQRCGAFETKEQS